MHRHLYPLMIRDDPRTCCRVAPDARNSFTVSSGFTGRHGNLTFYQVVFAADLQTGGFATCGR